MTQCKLCKPVYDYLVTQYNNVHICIYHRLACEVLRYGLYVLSSCHCCIFLVSSI